MSTLVGLLMLGAILLVCLALLAVIVDAPGRLVMGLLGTGLVGLIVGVVVAIYVVATGAGAPTYVEGHCYAAVSESHPTVMIVGKVIIPTTTRGIGLVEIDCP